MASREELNEHHVVYGFSQHGIYTLSTKLPLKASPKEALIFEALDEVREKTGGSLFLGADIVTLGNPRLKKAKYKLDANKKPSTDPYSRLVTNGILRAL